jgi:hypothetical protein
MIKKTLILLGLLYLNGCSAIGFDKGLNYKKISDYKFEYNKGSSGYVVITNKKNGNHISIAFRQNSCGSYGLIGPLIFPIIPIWENDDCSENATFGIGATKEVRIIYHDKTYKPSKISDDGHYYIFPLSIKSITEIATLVVEKKNGEKFEIPFRYQHTFSFDLWPGR